MSHPSQLWICPGSMLPPGDQSFTKRTQKKTLSKTPKQVPTRSLPDGLGQKKVDVGSKMGVTAEVGEEGETGGNRVGI